MRWPCGSTLKYKMARTGQGSCERPILSHGCAMRWLCGSTLKYKITNKIGRTGQWSGLASFFVVQVCCAMALWFDTKIYNYK